MSKKCHVGFWWVWLFAVSMPGYGEVVVFQNGLNGYYEQTDAMMQAGLWGYAPGYSEPGYRNYGMGSMFFQQSDSTYWARNLLKFDLEGLFPEGATVTRATLTLTLRTAPDPTPANLVGLAAYKANQSWDINNTYWLNWGYGGNSPGYCNLSSPDGVTYFAPDVSAYYQCSMDLTVSMVQSWIDQPWTNYGVMLGQLDWQWYNFYVFGTELTGTEGMQYEPKLEVEYTYSAGARSLTRGHRTLLKKGLQILAMYTVNSFSMDVFHYSKCTTLDLVDDYLHWDWIQTDPNVLWARQNWNPILPAELPFLKNCVSLKENDEQDITTTQSLQNIKNRMDTFKAACPNAISYTNQWGSQFTYDQLHNYVLFAQPDMVMFDTYPFYPNQVCLPTFQYEYMAKYRRLGREGLDGFGAKPIPYGLYLQAFTQNAEPWWNHRVSESQMRINQFSAWTFGFKYVDLFVYLTPASAPQYQSVLFNGMGDSSPTTEFYQMTETNRQSRNLGPALIRLDCTDVRMKMGKHWAGRHYWYEFGEDWEANNSLPSGVTAWSTSADPYMTAISVSNPGPYNTYRREDLFSSWYVELPGDVIIGYFSPLHETFDGLNYSNQKYFMITNGLCDNVGNAYGCRQTITVDFNFGSSGINSLQRMRRSDGAVETIVADGTYDGLTFTALGGSGYRLVVTLDGGTGDLFKYNTGARFVGQP